MIAQDKTLLLLKPRGFCAGVVRAIDIVRIALDAFGPPIYVRKEIVHNRYVVEELKAKGAIFVDEVYEVPDGQRLIYSAHGVAPGVREASKVRDLKVIDATCPLVTKVHVEAVKYAKGGYSIILIGHHDHDEVIGTLGEAPDVTQVVGSAAEVEQLQVPDPTRVAYITQTTVKDVAHDCDLLLVVGSENSSNSNRLVEVSTNLGTPSYLIDTAADIRPEWLNGVKTLALTAGASAPEVLVEQVMDVLKAKGFTNIREVEVVPENVRFGLPPEIVEAIAAAPAAAAE